MGKLQRGQSLECGCVVGYYWCGPHDIYARRERDELVWHETLPGRFACRTVKANAHRPPRDFRHTGYRYDGGADGCTCHICPPCSYCVDGDGEEQSDG